MENQELPSQNRPNNTVKSSGGPCGDFSRHWNMSDLVLRVENEDLHVHRCILSLWSPVFHRMFTGDFKEKHSDVIELPGKCVTEIRQMLEIIYDRRKKITDENYACLLQLADEFQIDRLRLEVAEFLKASDKSGTDALKYLRVASRYQLDKEIQQVCVEHAKQLSTEMLKDADAFQQLDSESKVLVLTARLSMVEEALKVHEASGNYLVTYLYNKAHDEFIGFLREHGLEETSLSKCENYEKHRSQYIGTGKKFCIHCKACRQRINAVHKFSVRTSDVLNTIETLYEIVHGTRKTKDTATDK
eukprot:gene3125-3593_t